MQLKRAEQKEKPVRSPNIVNWKFHIENAWNPGWIVVERHKTKENQREMIDKDDYGTGDVREGHGDQCIDRCVVTRSECARMMTRNESNSTIFGIALKPNTELFVQITRQTTHSPECSHACEQTTTVVILQANCGAGGQRHTHTHTEKQISTNINNNYTIEWWKLEINFAPAFYSWTTTSNKFFYLLRLVWLKVIDLPCDIELYYKIEFCIGMVQASEIADE